MEGTKRKILYFFILLLQVHSVTKAENQDTVHQEFRGIWIATVNNIDWPSKPGLPVEQLKRELRDLIDRINGFNLNAVFFQVRAAADAFYASETEPWSYFLTGKQGQPNVPFFDPLAYAVELCHSRGMKFHAWFNPFRVRVGINESINSFVLKNPQYLREYDKKRFLDPGYPQVRAHVVKVVLEVVRKYNIDGVVLDDYFYPYPVRKKTIPDGKTFAKYGKGFYPDRIKDWRRNNIDRFVSALHDSIKRAKPGLPFGISPFGVWRNKSDDPEGSPGVKGTTSYDDLYADVYKWLSHDWIDYIVPQLYWEQGNKYGDFTSLAGWWNDHSFGKPLYLSQALYRITDVKSPWANPKEISQQISILRKYSNIKGFAFYSASHLSGIPKEELNELNARLAKPKAEAPAIREVPPIIVNPVPVVDAVKMVPPEKELVIVKSLFESHININQDNKDKNLSEVPGNFRLKKDRSGWLISWSPSDTLKQEGRKFVLLTYRPEKDTCFLIKVDQLKENQQLIIPKDTDLNPGKAFYSFGSINEATQQRFFSKLFTIRKNRVVYH